MSRPSLLTVGFSLIMMTQMLSELPKQRYLSLKLYYTPETPPEYEPVSHSRASEWGLMRRHRAEEVIERSLCSPTSSLWTPTRRDM